MYPLALYSRDSWFYTHLMSLTFLDPYVPILFQAPRLNFLSQPRWELPGLGLFGDKWLQTCSPSWVFGREGFNQPVTLVT